MNADEKFMRLALKLAQKGAGRVSPNPLVGCVIVKNGKILAQGYHQRFGGAHAEIHALKKIKYQARGTTLYVNLEPCYHFGKTPPCVDTIIHSGVRRVVMAMPDPNPLTHGRSIRRLRAACVHVTVGVCQREAKHLNRFFVKFITQKMPYVIVKVAQSLDGKIAMRLGQQTWLTGRRSWDYVQGLRSRVDAVLVGRGTVAIDNPRLNVRDGRQPQPKRVILDSGLKTDLNRRVFHVPGGEIIFFCNLSPRHQRVRLFQSQGARVICLPGRKSLDLRAVLKKLSQLNVASVLVEGGAEVFTSFLCSGLTDEWLFILSPCLVGQDGVNSFAASRLKKIKLNQLVNLNPDTLLCCKILSS